MPRDRNESRGRLRWSGVTAVDVNVGSLLADVSNSTPTDPLPLQVVTWQTVSLAVHWPPRSSVCVESVTSAVQDPIVVSTTVLNVHRHRSATHFCPASSTSTGRGVGGAILMQKRSQTRMCVETPCIPLS